MNTAPDFDSEPDAVPALQAWAASQRDTLAAARAAALGALASQYVLEKVRLERHFEDLGTQLEGVIEMRARELGGDMQH